jgi:DNA mismatch endonuclease (patch repair protein)
MSPSFHNVPTRRYPKIPFSKSEPTVRPIFTEVPQAGKNWLDLHVSSSISRGCRNGAKRVEWDFHKMDTRTPQQRSRIMSSVNQRNTGPETAVRRILFALGYRFRLHRRSLPGKPDIVFPSRKKVIFVHGCFWHGHDCSKGHAPKSRAEYWVPKIQRNRDRDQEQLAALARAGWATLIVWQCELRDTVRLSEKLDEFLASSTVDLKISRKRPMNPRPKQKRSGSPEGLSA